MSQIKRRQFLQFTGSALATVSFNQFNLQEANHFTKVLAQNTPRKLALLVGINQYAQSDRFSNLKGCITDVELQRKLLIHRFGFNPQDILTLTDAQATRQGIFNGFEEHLIAQAQPGDVVVFHFSGQGDRIIDSECNQPHCFLNTLVPADSIVNQDGSVSDITQPTLLLLMMALKTENTTAVLDINLTGSGNDDVSLTSSSVPNISRVQPQLSVEERVYQKRWLRRLELSPEEFIELHKTRVAKGVVITSTERNQLATDMPLDNFQAGVFTYLMTQYLWQQTHNEGVESAIINITRSIRRVSPTRQVPELAVKSGSGNEKRPVYFTELQTPPAEAVITKVKGSQVELWLGGLDSQSLQAFAGGAILSIVDNAGREQGLVQLDSRRALVGQGKVLNASRDAVQPGALLQERVRGIPKNVSLRIGLDLSLGKDLTAAIQALQAIKGIEALPLQHTGIDYILGRITPSSQQEVQQSEEALPPIGSIGLFLPGLALVPDSFGTTGETVRDAVTRLKAKLKSLLAVRLLKLALNTNSSRLNVAAGMILDNKQQSVIGKVVSVRGASKQLRLNRGIEQQNSLSPRPVATPVATAQRSVTPLTPGTPVRFYFTNDEPRELYCCIVVISSTGEIAVLFPNQWTVAEDVVRVGAGQTLQVPDLGKDDFSFVAQGPHGVLEVLIIASSKPLRNGLKALRVIASSRGHRHGPIAFDTPDDPMDVIASLLDDLDMSAARNTEPSIHRLDVTQLAVMSISAEVI